MSPIASVQYDYDQFQRLSSTSQTQLNFNGHHWPVLQEEDLSNIQSNTKDSERWEIIFKDSSRFWVHYIFHPIVVFIGTAGNAVTIYILTRKPMRSSTNVYLTALATSDLFYLFFSFTMSWRHFPMVNKNLVVLDIQPLGLWLTDASSSTSVWLTVSFTVERYIAVCHPMKRKIYCTEMRALGVSILVYVTCFALTATTPFEWRAVVDLNQTEEYNETSYGLESTEFGRSDTYRIVYHWFTIISFVILPLVTLGILNYFLIKAVRSSRLERMCLTNEKLSSILKLQATRNENRITVTLIAVVILFSFVKCHALVLIYTSIHMPDPGTKEAKLWVGGWVLGNILQLVGGNHG
ncbi:FMRFamide receptor, partial [Orchesella cincta]